MDNNNVQLIISGNFTGFSRFFDTRGISGEPYKGQNINFDLRNAMRVLQDGWQKVYAISFAEKVVAASIVTPILDAANRPGVLVVTVPMPRGKKVRLKADPANPDALYQLLNKVNERFYENNFVNGKLVQVIDALMQDFYSDVLEQYELVDDSEQRKVNISVDLGAMLPKCGYVEAAERDIAKYLDTPCRRNYDRGLHHIILAQGIPAEVDKIDEKPVEEILYTVETPDGRRLTNKKLDDRIPEAKPQSWQDTIDTDYTYRQVLDGTAGDAITATRRDETITLDYHYPEKSKTIKFVFYINGENKEVGEVAPTVTFPDKRQYAINRSEYKFLGKETVEEVTLSCNSDKFSIEKDSKKLDLKRYEDGDEVTVFLEEKKFPVILHFTGAYTKEKTITFQPKNGGNPVTISGVTYKLDTALRGRQEDWTYKITSDHYKQATGELKPLLSGEEKLVLFTKPGNNESPNREEQRQKADTHKNESGGKAKENRLEAKPTDKKDALPDNNKKSLPLVTTYGNDTHINDDRGKGKGNFLEKLLTKRNAAFAGIIAALACLVLAIVFVPGIRHEESKDEKKSEDTPTSEVEKTFKLILVDDKGSNVGVEVEGFDELFSIKAYVMDSAHNKADRLQTNYIGNKAFAWTSTHKVPKDSTIKFMAEAYFQIPGKDPIELGNKTFSSENEDTVRIETILNKDQVELCLEIVNFYNGWNPQKPKNKEKDNLKKRADALRIDEIKTQCKDLLKKLEATKDTAYSPGQNTTGKKKVILERQIEIGILGRLQKAAELSNSQININDYTEKYQHWVTKSTKDSNYDLRKEVIKKFFSTNGDKKYADLNWLLDIGKNELEKKKKELEGNNK